MNFEMLMCGELNCHFLRAANDALLAKNYEQSLRLYELAKLTLPDFTHIIESNISRAYNMQKNNNFFAQNEKKISVDMVVPVYNALEDVKTCLNSIANNIDGFDVHVYVVNDASDNNTSQWLQDFCNKNSSFVLLENPKNLGYTASVNIGLRASSADYVIIQNSDTIVASGWLHALIRCMQSEEKIGIVGPLSNAANFQNVPKLKDDITGAFAINTLNSAIDLNILNEALFLTSAQVYPRIPIVNGFCFMIRRKVIDTIGYMDEVNFPIGYGEENDYCIRAKDAGFELAIADDVYVYHSKSKSFGEAKREELKINGKEKQQEKHGSLRYYNILNDCNTNAELYLIRKQFEVLLEQVLLMPKLENIKILIHLHVFYHDQLEYFIDKLKNITFDFDLHVTMVEENEESIHKILNFKSDAHVETVNNIGYDIYPFWKTLQQYKMENYDYVLKLHTKGMRNVVWENNNVHFIGYEWRNSLVESIIGSKKIFFQALEQMESNEVIGMLGANNLLRSYENESQIENTKQICVKMGINYDAGATFVCGTMFLVRSNVLQPFKKTRFCEADFAHDASTGHIGTLAHSLETVFGLLVKEQKMYVQGLPNEHQSTSIMVDKC